MPSDIPNDADKHNKINGAKRPAYQFERPERIPLKIWISRTAFRRAIKSALYLFAHTVLPYAGKPTSPQRQMTFDEPKGKIQQDHVALCQHIFETVESRRGRLEEKSSSMVTMLSILAPLIVSFLVFVIISDLSLSCLRVVAIVLATFSVISILLAITAIFRTLWIQSSQVLYFGSIIDYEKDEIKSFDADAIARGLLSTSSYNNALNDHLADFVKASQFLSMVSIFFMILSVFPAIYGMPQKPAIQRIEGEVNLSESLINEARTLYARIETLLERANRGLAEINTQLARIAASQEISKSLKNAGSKSIHGKPEEKAPKKSKSKST